MCNYYVENDILLMIESDYVDLILGKRTFHKNISILMYKTLHNFLHH